jgi:class 3 adenylate cyclase
MVRHEERRGELLTAYDVADRGLVEHPGHVDLAFRAVLVLARTGATHEAERRFIELGLAEVQTEDVAALHARIQKDRALAATGSDRLTLAAMAASAYRRVYDQTGSYFPAINAATLSLIAGDPEAATVLAAQTLTVIDASSDDSYYAVATRAEALLLLGDEEAARVELGHAAQIHDGDFGAISTTRRQLRTICATIGTDTGLLSVLCGPAVAHYCGHMMSASDGTGPRHRFDETDATRQIAEVLRRRPVGFAYGSLANGADVLWAEALLGAGAELHVVFPCALDDFLAASVAPAGQDWIQRFHHCLEQAVSVTYATEGRFLGDDALFEYCAELAMGLALLRARFLDADVFQLALLDAEYRADGAGTAGDVGTWRSTGHDVITITPVAGRDQDDHRRPARSPHTESVRVVRAVLMGDMRGYSKLTDEQLVTFSEVVLQAFSAVLHRYDHEIDYRNTWGDALIGVLRHAEATAHCALDLQDAMAGIDLAASGLPPHLALRLSGHVGPIFPVLDPVLGTPSFVGSHINRTARIEPVTPPGAVYVTEAFAASLELARCTDLRCDYVGHMPTAKDFGRLRMYHLVRRTPVTGETSAWA